jgi:hypothetical protein
MSNTKDERRGGKEWKNEVTTCDEIKRQSRKGTIVRFATSSSFKFLVTDLFIVLSCFVYLQNTI